MNTLMDLTRAYHFAAVKHAAQRRKGEAGEPYINHLTEVAELVAEATQGRDTELVIAAVLHDAVEDAGVTLREIEVMFGPRVADLVGQVSDDKSLPKAERKRLQVVHAADASDGAKLLKLADKTANLSSLVSSPPADWSTRRRREYVEWAREVVAGCAGVAPDLERRFHAAADAAWAAAA